MTQLVLDICLLFSAMALLAGFAEERECVRDSRN